MALVGEQPRQPVAQERLVLGDDHPHGRVALRLVPAPGRDVISRVPPCERARSARPSSPVPRRRSAPPIPSSSTATTSWPASCATASDDAPGLGVLDSVGEPLGGDEVGGGLDLGGEPLGGDVEPDRGRGPGGEVVEGSAQSVVEARRPQTTGKLAKIVDRVGELADGLVEVMDRLRGGSVQSVLDMPQGEPDGHKTLLGAVVKIAGQSTPFLVGDGRDACPRCVELVDLAAQIDLERGDLEGQPARVQRLDDQALHPRRVHHDGGQPGTGRDRGAEPRAVCRRRPAGRGCRASPQSRCRRRRCTSALPTAARS